MSFLKILYILFAPPSFDVSSSAELVQDLALQPFRGDIQHPEL